jgi:hypothetical protein
MSKLKCQIKFKVHILYPKPSAFSMINLQTVEQQNFEIWHLPAYRRQGF